MLYHAADNAFPDWEEFNRIAALGGWGGRDERSGPYLYWKDGSLVRDTTKGPGGSHGEQREYSMNGRNAEHPVVGDCPGGGYMRPTSCTIGCAVPPMSRNCCTRPMPIPDEEVPDARNRWFYRRLRKARIFHLMIGHADPSLEDNPAMQCTGFQTLLLRGSEWAATGKVRQRVPDDFPTERKSSLRKDYRKP